MGLLTRLLVLFGLLLLFCSYGSFAVRRKRERELLESDLYADTVLKWEKIQAWFVCEPRPNFKPFPLLLDTGGLVAMEIMVGRDDDGKIFLPKDLSPTEFVLAVNRLEEYFNRTDNLSDYIKNG